MRSRTLPVLLLFVALLLTLPVIAWAITSPSPVADERTSIVYADPTVENFSKLYWALSKFEITDTDAVDNYLMINECDIYEDYWSNEFEWKKVRETAQKFLKENKSYFQRRFNITIPIKLGEYNIEKSEFQLVKDFQINGIRRFEVYANDYMKPVCNNRENRAQGDIPNYPRGLLVELSRLLMMTTLKVDHETAEKYIAEKNLLQKARPTNDPEKRDAYIVLKVKIFSYRKETKMTQGITLAEVLGILEGIEVYSDPKKKKLIYSESFIRKNKTKDGNSSFLKSLPPSPMLLQGKKPAEKKADN